MPPNADRMHVVGAAVSPILRDDRCDDRRDDRRDDRWSHAMGLSQPSAERVACLLSPAAVPASGPLAALAQRHDREVRRRVADVVLAVVVR